MSALSPDLLAAATMGDWPRVAQLLSEMTAGEAVRIHRLCERLATFATVRAQAPRFRCAACGGSLVVTNCGDSPRGDKFCSSECFAEGAP